MKVKSAIRDSFFTSFTILIALAMVLPFPTDVNGVTTDWVRRYAGPGNGDDQARAIAVDGSGNVYVTGSSWNAAGNYDYFTAKYDSSGTRQWIKRYDGPGHVGDTPYAIVVDGSGNVYVTGTSGQSATNYDFATLKYSSTGAVLW